ncbi:hypothetical protein C0J52_16896 [Blattella germanica]|nr:hypothetical protein C0J52_16896 [Blattella germanica]
MFSFLLRCPTHYPTGYFLLRRFALRCPTHGPNHRPPGVAAYLRGDGTLGGARRQRLRRSSVEVVEMQLSSHFTVQLTVITRSNKFTITLLIQGYRTIVWVPGAATSTH